MDSSQVFALADPRSVDIAAIERELEEIWRTSAAPGEEPAVARISLLNLVACTHDPERAGRAASEIASVTVYHPCRAIIVAADPESGPPEIRASVAAYCHRPDSGPKPVCCEQIRIEAKGEAVSRLPAILPPLLVPDLPRFLWWMDAPDFHSDLFRRVIGDFDRLILDSNSFREIADLARMIEFNSQIPLSDLNWTRLNVWQELVAEFFDPPAFRPYLPQIENVTLDYAPESLSSGQGSEIRAGAGASQAFLFAAWLAARLEWEPRSLQKDGPDLLLGFRHQDQPVAVRIRTAPLKNTPPGELDSIRIETGGSPSVTFNIHRIEDGSLGLVSVEMEGACPLPRRVSLLSGDTPSLLCEELEILGRNPLFEEALYKVALILRM